MPARRVVGTASRAPGPPTRRGLVQTGAAGIGTTGLLPAGGNRRAGAIHLAAPHPSAGDESVAAAAEEPGSWSIFASGTGGRLATDGR